MTLRQTARMLWRCGVHAAAEGVHAAGDGVRAPSSRGAKGPWHSIPCPCLRVCILYKYLE